MKTSKYPHSRAWRLMGVALAAGLAWSAPAVAGKDCHGKQSLRLVNGKIHTMDAKGTVVSTVVIQDGKFVKVGKKGNGGAGKCTRTVNLHGRTAVPGLIDNHNHIILLGLRPGNDVRLDLARSIPAALAILADKAAEVGPGKWVVTLGGVNPNQFFPDPVTPDADVRFPSLAELDAALPNNPVLLFTSFAGPSQTNSLGKAFFEAGGVTVGADGSIASGFFGGPSLQALQLLRDLPEHNNLEAQIRGLLDALRFGAKMGLTTHVDQGSFHFADSFFGNTGTIFDALASFDQYRAFDSLRALHAGKQLPARVQVNYLHIETNEATPELRARLDNTVPLLGDQWVSNGGIGEFTGGSPFGGLGSPAWENATRLTALHGWRNENHSLGTADFQTILNFWSQVDGELKGAGIPQTILDANGDPIVVGDPIVDPNGITDLRWVLAHVPFITPPFIQLANDLGVGLSVLGGWRWLSGSQDTGDPPQGPPFRSIMDNGGRQGMSSDGMQISVMSPWIGMYYAVTGKNARGRVINGGETISREAALRLYTADNAWFLGPMWERKLGTIEKGRWGDVVVLSANYFDEGEVSDDEIQGLHSVLTIVNGRVVYDEIGDGKKKDDDDDSDSD